MKFPESIHMFKVLLLICLPILAVISYYYIAGFFRMQATATLEEINEDSESETENLNEKEAKMYRLFSLSAFMFLGNLIWGGLGMYTGKLAHDLSPASFWKFFFYFIVYFICLRIPFGLSNRMIKHAVNKKIIREKIVFSILMIMMFILGINFA